MINGEHLTAMNIVQDNPQQTVLAYLAGIIDGEGCIRLAKLNDKRTTVHPSVNCGMTQAAPVELLHQTFGGSVTWKQPTCKNASPCKPLLYWYASGANSAAKVLRQLYPYLRAKKEQAAIVLDFCFNKVDGRKAGGVSQEEHRWREELYWKVKKLNQRGVAATTEFERRESACDSLLLQETVRESPEVVAPTL